jgi:hypothetical protein
MGQISNHFSSKGKRVFRNLQSDHCLQQNISADFKRIINNCSYAYGINCKLRGTAKGDAIKLGLKASVLSLSISKADTIGK